MRPMAESICESFARRGQAADGSGAWLSGPRPRRRHALHRRAAADAAGPRRAQPHHRRALRAGRAVHRAASRQHRRPHGRDARSGGGRQFRVAGGSRHADTRRSRLSGGNGPGRGRGRRACHRAGNGGATGREPRFPDRAVSLRETGAGRSCGRGRAGEELFGLGRLRLVHRGHPHRASRWRWNFPRGG